MQDRAWEIKEIQVPQDVYKKTEKMLELYMKVKFRIKLNLAEIDTELYVEDRKHLSGLINEIIDFDITDEKKRIQNRLFSNEVNLCLLEIMEDTLLILKEYPDEGELYYQMLRYRYFESCKNRNEDVMLLLDDMPCTTYYRKRKKAITLFVYHGFIAQKTGRREARLPVTVSTGLFNR